MAGSMLSIWRRASTHINPHCSQYTLGFRRGFFLSPARHPARPKQKIRTFAPMKKIHLLILTLFFAHIAVAQKAPEISKTAFPDTALVQPLFDLEGAQTTTGAVLEAYKGKTVLLYIWAMWCPDCLEGFPALQAFQAANPD